MIYLQGQENLFQVVDFDEVAKRDRDNCSQSFQKVVALPENLIEIEKLQINESKRLEKNDYLLLGTANFSSKENYLTVSQSFFNVLHEGSLILSSNSSLHLQLEKKDFNFALCKVIKGGILSKNSIFYLEEQFNPYLYAVEYIQTRDCNHLLLDYEKLSDLSFLIIQTINKFHRVNWVLKIQNQSLKKLKHEEKLLCDYLWLIDDASIKDEVFFPEQFLHAIARPCQKDSKKHSALYLSIMQSIEYLKGSKHFSCIALKNPPLDLLTILKAQYPDVQWIIYNVSLHEEPQNKSSVHRFIPQDLDFKSRIMYIAKDSGKRDDLIYLEIDEASENFNLVYIA